MIPDNLLFQMDTFTGVYALRYDYVFLMAFFGSIACIMIYHTVHRKISAKTKESLIGVNTIPNTDDPLFIERLTGYLRREIGGFALPEAHTAREMRIHALKSILADIEHREYAGLGFSVSYIDDILDKIHALK